MHNKTLTCLIVTMMLSIGMPWITLASYEVETISVSITDYGVRISYEELRQLRMFDPMSDSFMQDRNTGEHILVDGFFILAYRSDEPIYVITFDVIVCPDGVVNVVVVTEDCGDIFSNDIIFDNTIARIQAFPTSHMVSWQIRAMCEMSVLHVAPARVRLYQDTSAISMNSRTLRTELEFGDRTLVNVNAGSTHWDYSRFRLDFSQGIIPQLEIYW
jgi:hypothetical protein